MSDPQHQPNPTASVYALRYLHLLDILRDERATKPRLNTAEPAEWLNWAHAVHWLIVSCWYLLPPALLAQPAAALDVRFLRQGHRPR